MGIDFQTVSSDTLFSNAWLRNTELFSRQGLQGWVSMNHFLYIIMKNKAQSSDSHTALSKQSVCCR